jgi:hypothetical protein
MNFTFLDQNARKIWTLHHAGGGPASIAQTLCTDANLKPGSVNSKQISNWLDYRKKSGQGRTRSVSFGNDNLRADDGDCMSFFCIFITTYKQGSQMHRQSLEMERF